MDGRKEKKRMNEWDLYSVRRKIDVLFYVLTRSHALGSSDGVRFVRLFMTDRWSFSWKSTDFPFGVEGGINNSNRVRSSLFKCPFPHCSFLDKYRFHRDHNCVPWSRREIVWRTLKIEEKGIDLKFSEGKLLPRYSKNSRKRHRRILERSLRNKWPNSREPVKVSIDGLEKRQRQRRLCCGRRKSGNSILPGEMNVSNIWVIPNNGKRNVAAFTAFLEAMIDYSHREYAIELLDEFCIHWTPALSTRKKHPINVWEWLRGNRKEMIWIRE